MRIYKEIRDDFSEKIILDKRSEGWVGFKLLRVVVRASRQRRSPCRCPVAEKSCEYDTKEASVTQWKQPEAQREKTEKISIGWPCRACRLY